MRRALLAILLLLATLGAAAARRHHQASSVVKYIIPHHHVPQGHAWHDGRPHAWCGWQMRQWFGGGPLYNLARAWAHRGRPTVPHVGAIVVWPHHVGYITGRSAAGWIVKSGNDGNRVRERVRSLAGVIAVRAL